MTKSCVIDMTLMMKLTSSWHDITTVETNRILWNTLLRITPLTRQAMLLGLMWQHLVITYGFFLGLLMVAEVGGCKEVVSFV